jgi:hypothetical protein
VILERSLQMFVSPGGIKTTVTGKNMDIDPDSILAYRYVRSAAKAEIPT